MIRIHIVCEGHTEEMFVNELLAPYMINQGIYAIATKIGKPGHKGGNVNYQRLLTDLKIRLLGDRHCYCTTLIDFYGLSGDFPGKKEATKCAQSREKFELVTQAFKEKIKMDIGDASHRFIPYIQLHEFEGLLFSNPHLLASSLQQISLSGSFQEIRKKCITPEDINDSPNTAPSKRIAYLYTGYAKPLHPILAAKNIGINAIRQECPLFNDWLRSLEILANKSKLDSFGGDT